MNRPVRRWRDREGQTTTPGTAIKGAFFVILLLLTIPLTGEPARLPPSTELGIEGRIDSAIDFIKAQLVNSSRVVGFAHNTTIGAPIRMYAEDAGLVILALSAYQETHFSNEFYPYIRLAVSFLKESQTGTGDFYEYYDVNGKDWANGGGFYRWDPFAIMGPAYAAYVISDQVPEERAYWATVVDRMRAGIDYWLPKMQAPDGSLTFQSPRFKIDVAANAAMLTGLIYLAVFEHLWGDTSLATKYAKWSENIARWLYSLQEKNSSSWGYGGFYTDAGREFQGAFENGLAMLGLNSYYKSASLLLENSQPGIEDLRKSMILWEENFVEKILDGWGGPVNGRSKAVVQQSWQTTSGATSVLQAAVDVWINIGPPRYWNDSARVYHWLTGNNELLVDLQGPPGLAGIGRGFYAGIAHQQVLNSSDLWSSALALYALIRADFVAVTGKYPVCMGSRCQTLNRWTYETKVRSIA